METISIHTSSHKEVETVSVSPSTGLFPIRVIKKFYALIPVIILLLTVHSFGYQEKGSREEKKKPVLTDEEKEMLKDREILENLTLLKNLDEIKFLDLLNKMDPDWSEKDDSVIPEDEEEEE